MKLIRATIADSYKVHRTYAEYLKDVGRVVKDEELYESWPRRLTDPDQFFYLLTHNRKVVGMVWGRELLVDGPKKTALIEGRFLRRAFREKARFTRNLVEAVKKASQGYERVMLLLPKGRVKIPGKYNVLGTLVEGT